MKNLKMILTGQRPLKDVWHYFVGNYRYKFYYNIPFRWLLRKHIKEQIHFRCSYVPDACWNQGSCVKCGCMVPSLQMAFKSCDGDCYPELMNIDAWSEFKGGGTIRQKDKYWRLNLATNVVILSQNVNQYVPERRPKLR